MGRVWRKHTKNPKPGSKSSKEAGPGAVQGTKKQPEESFSGSESNPVETVLPSDGIMAIYQQFRQIWRRHPQQQAATASNHMLPPGYHLPQRSAGLSALELALGGAQRVKRTTAPAA